MRKIFHVDVVICDDEELPTGLDLESFCEMLQEEVPGVKIVSATVSKQGAAKLAVSLVLDHVFNEALAEYSDRYRTAGRRSATRERSSFLILFVLAHSLPSPPPGFDVTRN